MSVDTKNHHALINVTLALGAGLTIASLTYSGGWSSLWSGFALWGLLPYGVLLGCRPLALTRGRSLATLIVSVLSVGFAVVAYADVWFRRTGSTSSLGFVVVPLYQLVLAFILFAVLLFTKPPSQNRP
jgi:hypothetical protein